MLRWVASRVLGLLLARYRWATRLVVVVSIVKWIAARRRNSAVVKVRRGETLVIGLDDASTSARGGARGR